MSILVTGGAGFIGSHTVIELIQAHYDVIILDNLSNSSNRILPRLHQIVGQEIPFYQGDIRNRSILREIFSKYNISTVMHFASLKSVGESMFEPVKYYDNNVVGSLILAEEMAAAGVFNIVFSSSATVYGDPIHTPITEDMPTGGTTNPYGTSKYIIERILADIQKANPCWSVILLRYFNPIGAHESGLIGEHPSGTPNNLLPYISERFQTALFIPSGTPNNLLPYICQVASGKLPYLSVFGNDYPTPDGTGVRDYIHVVDLAQGHLKAMQAKSHQSGMHIYNLGTGNGHSVLEIIHAFEQASGLKIPFQIQPRRPGDIATCFADPTYTSSQTGWRAQRNLQQMMQDAWRWQSQNPNGYD